MPKGVLHGIHAKGISMPKGVVVGHTGKAQVEVLENLIPSIAAILNLSSFDLLASVSIWLLSEPKFTKSSTISMSSSSFKLRSDDFCLLNVLSASVLHLAHSSLSGVLSSH